MLRKVLKLILLVPFGVLIVMFAVANRQVVTVSLDIFGADPPLFSITAPLFIVILLTLLTGVIVGGVAAWLNQARWRRDARRARAEASRLAAEAREMRDRQAASGLPMIGRDPTRRRPAA